MQETTTKSTKKAMNRTHVIVETNKKTAETTHAQQKARTAVHC